MRRTIGRFVEAPIAEMLLRKELLRGDVAYVDGEDGRVVVTARSQGKKREPAAFSLEL
jgi:DNA helicase TIP49 (TBP-interacting protein)